MANDMTDKEVAEQIREAATNLNNQMASAAKQGLKVEINTYDVFFYEKGSFQEVAVSVTKELMT